MVAEFVGARHCLALSPHARVLIEGDAMRRPYEGCFFVCRGEALPRPLSACGVADRGRRVRRPYSSLTRPLLRGLHGALRGRGGDLAMGGFLFQPEAVVLL